jgi:hypothetical protein
VTGVATIDEHLIVLETEFRTELKHLATKADLQTLESKLQAVETRLLLRLGGLMVAGFTVVVAVLRLWE